MSNEVALPQPPTDRAEVETVRGSALVEWAQDARVASQIATSLSRTSFVPATMRGKADDVTAAILAGQELGLKPMATLRSMDVINGVPSLRAHAMRGLIQSHGHQVQVVTSTDTVCKMRGRRAGEQEWQEVVWTIERARLMGLIGKSAPEKDQWIKQPRTMLIARATAELCRLIAADVLYAMPYATEEMQDEVDRTPIRVTADEIRKPGGWPSPTEVDDAEPKPDIPQEPAQDAPRIPDPPSGHTPTDPPTKPRARKAERPVSAEPPLEVVELPDTEWPETTKPGVNA